MKVKRALILRAIRTEPLLKKGQFVLQDDNKEICQVCAVGSVIRNALKTTNAQRIYRVSLWNALAGDYTQDGNPRYECKREYYWSALSARFEKLSLMYGNGKKTRALLCKFVKKNFPKEIELITRN